MLLQLQPRQHASAWNSDCIWQAVGSSASLCAPGTQTSSLLRDPSTPTAVSSAGAHACAAHCALLVYIHPIAVTAVISFAWLQWLRCVHCLHTCNRHPLGCCISKGPERARQAKTKVSWWAGWWVWCAGTHARVPGIPSCSNLAPMCSTQVHMHGG
jgi:hypothetical protein